MFQVDIGPNDGDLHFILVLCSLVNAMINLRVHDGQTDAIFGL